MKRGSTDTKAVHGSALVSAPAGEYRVDVRAIKDDVTRMYDDLRAPVLRYLISIGLSAHDGEEIVQETFLALFNHLKLGRPRTNLRAWVFQVAHNQALKRRRAVHRDQARTAAWLDGFDLIADATRDPEQLAILEQRIRQIRTILRSLPERDQRCLSLCSEGLRYREIAQVLDVSLATVSRSIQRSVSRLNGAKL